MPYRLEDKHTCTLNVDSLTALPKLHPYAPKWQRWLREFRKLLLISPKNPRTKLRFRSQESILTEARRHLKKSKITIHPYSVMAMLRDIIIYFTWVTYFYASTLFLTLTKQERILRIRYVLYSLKPLLALQVVLSFFMGFYNSSNDYIEVKTKKTVKNYLFGYFVFDLLFFLNPYYEFTNPTLFVLEGCVILLMFVRVASINRYFRVVTLLLDFGESFHDLLCLILTGFMLTHFSAVVVYSMANFEDKFGLLRNTSWVVIADVAPNSNNSGLRKYLLCMHKVCAMFLGPSSGMWKARNLEEIVVFTIIILTGMFYMAYVTALVLQMSMSLRSSNNLYNHILYQIMYYCRVKKLPDNIRNRMKMYYVSRFKSKYFRENFILSTLSEHLQLELKLHNCRKLLQSSWLFQTLPPKAVGRMVMELETLVVLPNDVIKDYKDTDNIYFITSGEVAMVSYEGMEILHISDGEYFGDFSVLSKMGIYDADETNMKLTYVAVYVTELLVMHIDAFSHYMSKYPETLERMKQIAKLRDLLNLEKIDKLYKPDDFVINRKMLSRSVRRGERHSLYSIYGVTQF